jgi:hypothetical protein
MLRAGQWETVALKAGVTSIREKVNEKNALRRKENDEGRMRKVKMGGARLRKCGSRQEISQSKIQFDTWSSTSSRAAI